MSRYLIFFVLLSSCRYDNVGPSVNTDYLVFGTYYGMCAGNCVHMFMITNDGLYQVNNTPYPNQQQRYDISSVTKLSDEKFESVKDLKQNFPGQLKDETQKVFGCPDCTDGGGTYLEIASDGEIKYWYVDNTGHNVPSYIRDYVDAIIQATNSLSR